MIKQDILGVLGRIGFRKNEAEVYLACLDTPEGMRVQDIVAKTKMIRSSVNLIISRLLDRGFLSYYYEGNRKMYVAEPPEHLLDQLENSLSDFKSILPLLAHITATGESKIRYFLGTDDVVKIYNDSLLTLTMKKGEEKELLAISCGKDVQHVMPNHEKIFVDRRIKEGIPLRWIAPDIEYARVARDGEKYLREIRFFDGNKYPFDIELDVYANKVALIDLGDNPSGFIIENEVLSRSMRSLFNLLWDSLGKRAGTKTKNRDVPHDPLFEPDLPENYWWIDKQKTSPNGKP